MSDRNSSPVVVISSQEVNWSALFPNRDSLEYKQRVEKARASFKDLPFKL